MSAPTRQQLMSKLVKLLTKLARHGIRDTSDYAKVLIAEALQAERVLNAINQGFDLISSKYGRVEVKCRVLPTDGRIEERVDLKDSKVNGFDYLAIVVFFPDFSVKGSILVPYCKVWPIIDSRPYRRISYGEACQLEDIVDITELVSSAAHH